MPTCLSLTLYLLHTHTHTYTHKQNLYLSLSLSTCLSHTQAADLLGLADADSLHLEELSLLSATVSSDAPFSLPAAGEDAIQCVCVCARQREGGR